MRSATDLRAWIRINGDLGLTSRSLRRIADIGFDELGPLVNIGEPFAAKVPLFLSELVGQSSTDQERLSTQWMISARRCHITSAFCTHYCINHTFSPVRSSMDDHTRCVTHLAYLLFRSLLMKRFRDGGELNTGFANVETPSINCICCTTCFF